MNSPDRQELARIYASRFAATSDYRRRVWQILVPEFFQRFVPEAGTVLDLGCGYGEFINTVRAKRKLAMDLNPESKNRLNPEVTFLQQNCSRTWSLDPDELDVVFTSNFFEHLPDKQTLGLTLDQAFRCLKRGGRLIALGPNYKYVGGRYWDFWDHHLPLTETSLTEGLGIRGFEIERCESRFLPYTIVGGPEYPLWMLSLYLKCKLLWRLKGEQFLVVARKPDSNSQGKPA
jgi:SAM-dependent methyltransferase